MKLLVFNLVTDTQDPVLGFTTRWLNALADHCEKVYVLTMYKGKVSVKPNVEVYSVGKDKGYSDIKKVREFYRVLLKLLKTKCIDACFSHMMPRFTLMGAPLLRAQDIPVITWYAHRQRSLILRMAHALSNAVVSVNNSSYPYSSSPKFKSLGHGIDLNLFSPQRADTENDSVPVILSVSRLSPSKNIKTIIDAIHRVLKIGHPVRGVIVGAAPERDRHYEENIHSYVKELGLSRHIKFTGSLVYEEISESYQGCSLFVNAASSDHSIDKAPLEAMACGKISFSSTKALKSTFDPFADKLLFQEADPIDLANKIIHVLNLGTNERIEMGTHLRSNIESMHSLENLSSKLVDLLIMKKNKK